MIMGYAEKQREAGLLTSAAHGTKCQGNTPYSGSPFRCAGDNGQPSDAVHTWEGRHYCAYHSPFDVIEGEFDMDVRHDPEWIVPYARNNDECPNCGGTIAPNGDRYSSESPRALICGGWELVYA
jgi:hypothetical protein